MEDFEVEAFRLRLAGAPTGEALARRLAEVEPSETVLAAQVAQGGALAWVDEDPGDVCGCGFCVPVPGGLWPRVRSIDDEKRAA